MNYTINALEAMIHSSGIQDKEKISKELIEIFTSGGEFLDKVKKFDSYIEANSQLNDISEYAFDLLMNVHLENKASEEDYFDTREWQEIEDKTLERGTELLNILLYLAEARDNEVQIELDDFLNEFLLIEEDEFQDEYKIYEDLIANAELVESSPEIIVETGSQIEVNQELKDLFVPLLLFFHNPNRMLEAGNNLNPLSRSIYHTLITYNQ